MGEGLCPHEGEMEARVEGEMEARVEGEEPGQDGKRSSENINSSLAVD